MSKRRCYGAIAPWGPFRHPISPSESYLDRGDLGRVLARQGLAPAGVTGGESAGSAAGAVGEVARPEPEPAEPVVERPNADPQPLRHRPQVAAGLSVEEDEVIALEEGGQLLERS